MSKKLKHDQLTKNILTEPVAAQEFLAYYLPADFKHILNLEHITIEPESYIEETLKQKYSDIVYSVATKNHGTAFVYILIEAKSSVDYWTALQLWKYTLLLCERHKKRKDKLPLVYNLVVYNGKEVYDAPRNLWDLFTDPIRAKQFIAQDYPLVDLQSMSDEEIVKKQHIGMLEYMLKHIHQRDMINLWGNFLENFKRIILVDKEKGFVYLTYFLWYTHAKLPQERQAVLVDLLDKYLLEEEKDNIMRTVAQKYIEEGRMRGKAEGKAEGIQIGEARGEARLLQMMLNNGHSIAAIASITNLSVARIKKLLNLT